MARPTNRDEMHESHHEDYKIVIGRELNVTLILPHKLEVKVVNGVLDSGWFPRFLSRRAIPLIFSNYGPERRLTPILTVEYYCKWYELYRVDPDDSVYQFGFDSLEDFCDGIGSPYVDHVPNPKAAYRFAEHNGWHLDDLAEEVMIGRWLLEVKEFGKER